MQVLTGVLEYDISAYIEFDPGHLPLSKFCLVVAQKWFIESYEHVG